MALINEDRLLGFVDGDRESLIELSQAFLSSVPGELVKARAAAQSGDLKQLVFSLHKLKSSVTIFHDGPATAKLGQLERRAMTGDGANVVADLATIDLTLQALLVEVKALVSRT